MRRRGWLWAVLICAACDGGGECAGDDDCEAGRHCALGRCIAQCDSDDDCRALGASATCAPARGLCVAPEAPDGGPAACAAHRDCDDGLYCNGPERCEPGGEGADARGCIAGAAPCEEGELCSEARLRCVAADCGEPDVDGDGRARVACGGDDCDDEDSNRYPGNAEVCDTSGHDEDCNPDTFGFADLDGDGYVAAHCCNDDGEGVAQCGDDCDDMNALRHPRHVEVCDAFDNDCDGEVDEEVVPTWYADADGDGYGDPGVARAQCMAPLGHVALGTDCDDEVRDVHPAAREDCNGIDDNCDSFVDAEDATVFACACLEGETVSCGVSDLGECRRGARSCSADGRFGACEGAIDPIPERCNALDEDCDGDVDEGVLTTCYRDVDGDLRGTPADVVETCGACPEGYVLFGGDCNDARRNTYTGAPELCDRLDNDCSIGGGDDVTEDRDDDGHASPTHYCSGGMVKDDCRDAYPTVYPGNRPYFEFPACPTGHRWCPSGLVTAGGCCILAADVCPGPVFPPVAPVCRTRCLTPDNSCTATHDYDCDGRVEIAPVSSGCVDEGSSCSGSGPTEQATSCDELVTHRECMSGGLGCVSWLSDAVAGCR